MGEKEMIKKAIIFSSWFEADDEFHEFCKSLGYNLKPNEYGNKSDLNFDIMFDPRVIEYCEKHKSKLWNEYVFKGKESFNFRCGFSGAAYFREIDTSKMWTIKYNQVDAPVITYVKIITNEYGYTNMTRYIEYEKH